MEATKSGTAVMVNTATGEITATKGTLQLPAELRGNLGALIAKARERAQLTAIEREWVKGEGIVGVVAGRGESAGPWAKVILHRVDQTTGNVTGEPEERLCPTVLWNEIAKGLRSGRNTFYMEYLGRKTSAAGGRGYHNFAVEALGAGKAITIMTDDDGSDVSAQG